MSICHRPQVSYHDQARPLRNVRLVNPLLSSLSLLHPVRQPPPHLSASTAPYLSLVHPLLLTINVLPTFMNFTALPSGPLSLPSTDRVQALTCSRRPGAMEMAMQVELHITPSLLRRRVSPQKVEMCIIERRSRLRWRTERVRLVSQRCLGLTLRRGARRRES